MTPAAWVLMAIGVLFIAAMILRWRLGRLLDMQKRLERLVAERTHALQSERRELLATREVLRQQATRDGLTGLLNRTAILEVLNREWKRAEPQFDLDCPDRAKIGRSPPGHDPLSQVALVCDPR